MNIRAPVQSVSFGQWLSISVSILTLLSVIFLGGRYSQDVESRLAEHQKWINQHEATAKDRRGEVEGSIGRVSAIVSQLDDRLDDAEALEGRLSDRVSALEARGVEMLTSQREMQDSLSEQSGDLKVILAWIDEQRRVQNPRATR